MSALKEELGVSATNITAMVDSLERDGLVTRQPHPYDRRATIIALTEGVECHLAPACAPSRAGVPELFSVLTESERKELVRLMGKLDALLKEHGLG